MKRIVLIGATVFILVLICFRTTFFGPPREVSLQFRSYTKTADGQKAMALTLTNGISHSIFYTAQGIVLLGGKRSKTPVYYTLEKIPDREEYPTVISSSFNHNEELQAKSAIDFQVPLPTNGNQLVSIHLNYFERTRTVTALEKMKLFLSRFFPKLVSPVSVLLTVKPPPEN